MSTRRSAGDLPPAGEVDGPAADDTTPKPPKSNMIALAGTVIVALVVLLVSPWRGGFGFVYMGIVPGIAAVIASPRAAFLSSAATTVAVFVGVGVSGSLPLSVLWMTVLAIGIVYASRYGASSIACMIAAQAAIVIVYGRVFAGAPDPFNQPHTWTGALPVAAFVLGGGLVVALAGELFLHRYHTRLGPRISAEDSWWFGASVIPLTVIGTWVCRGFFQGTHSWWFLLTVYVVLLPVSRLAIERMRGRVIGTVVGASFVAVVTFVVTEAELGVNVIYALALLAALATIAFSEGSPVLYAAFLTATVLFGGSRAANNPTLLHGERVVLTILGALAVMVALRFNDWLRERVEQRRKVAV